MTTTPFPTDTATYSDAFEIANRAVRMNWNEEWRSAANELKKNYICGGLRNVTEHNNAVVLMSTMPSEHNLAEHMSSRPIHPFSSPTNAWENSFVRHGDEIPNHSALFLIAQPPGTSEKGNALLEKYTREFKENHLKELLECTYASPFANEKHRAWVLRATLTPITLSKFTGNLRIKVRERQNLDEIRPWWVAYATQHEDIIAVLQTEGLDSIAARLTKLYDLVENDPEEPAIRIDSLRNLAHFVLSESRLATSRIGLSPSGLLEMEWMSDKKDVLAVWFLENGMVRFTGIAHKPHAGAEPERIGGILSKSELMQTVRPFMLRVGFS